MQPLTKEKHDPQRRMTHKITILSGGHWDPCVVYTVVRQELEVLGSRNESLSCKIWLAQNKSKFKTLSELSTDETERGGIDTN